MSKSLIFIVDDDPAFSQMLSVLLGKTGYKNISLFDSGEKCLAALNTEKPHFIFLDFSLGGLNGLDTLKMIKQRVPKTKVFIVTYIEDEGVKEKCLKNGATLYLNKSEISESIPPLLKKKMKRGIFL